jgi:tRNA-5-methyluridine54 2-sulfurtransferase
MKCTRCRSKVEVYLRQHNAGFCRPCFVSYFRRQVERAIHHMRMLSTDEEVLVAVSGGKDSLALWEVLHELGYRTTGLHLSLGIGSYSDASTEKTERFAEKLGRPLLTVRLAEEGPGLAIPSVTSFTHRPACSACGLLKRHYFDHLAQDRGFPVVATGHNLDDEAARLMGNVLRWQVDHLARQQPVLTATDARFVRKIKPLYRCSEYETAAYAFMRGIDYVVEECPNSVGASQLTYKDVLNRLEAASPGTKLAFVAGFLERARAGFATSIESPASPCARCGMPSYAGLCAYCKLVEEVEGKRARRAQRAATAINGLDTSEHT